MRTQGWRSLTLYILTGLFILGMGVFAFRLGNRVLLGRCSRITAI